MGSKKTWDFCYKNEVEAVDQFFQNFDEDHEAFMEDLQYIRYQEEQGKGDDEGHTHLQGTIQFKDKKYLSGAQQWFTLNIPNIPLPRVGYSKLGPQGLYNYSRKATTRVPDGKEFELGEFSGGGAKRKRHRRAGGSDDDEESKAEKRLHMLEFAIAGNKRNRAYEVFGDFVFKVDADRIWKEARQIRIARHEDVMKLKSKAFWDNEAAPWQRQVRDILMKWREQGDDRKILVILDENGGAGKTKFARKLIAEDPDRRVYQYKGKLENMAYHLRDMISLEYLIVNYAKGDAKYGSSKILEMVKDGMIQSDKYEPIQIPVDNVQIAVMTNREIDWSNLSMDRWEVYETDKSHALLNNGKYDMAKIAIHKWSDEHLEQKYADAAKAAAETEQRRLKQDQ